MLETVNSRGSRIKALRILAQRHLDRPYDKPRDGLAIASLTREEDVAPEIVGLLNQALAD